MDVMRRGAMLLAWARASAHLVGLHRVFGATGNGRGALLFAKHGTLAAAVTARPARWVIAQAKTLTAAVLGLLLGAVGIASGFTGAVTAGLGAGDTASIPATIGWALLFTSLSAVLGLGIGMILRHSAAAVGGLLVWGFVLEPLLNSFLPARVARFLPFVAGQQQLADLFGIQRYAPTR